MATRGRRTSLVDFFKFSKHKKKEPKPDKACSISQESSSESSSECSSKPEIAKDPHSVDSVFQYDHQSERRRRESMSISRLLSPDVIHDIRRRGSGDINYSTFNRCPLISEDRCTSGHQVALKVQDGSRNHIFKIDDMRIITKYRQQYLMVIVNLGQQFADGSVSVCALKDGSKLILTVTKEEPLGDGTTFERKYVDRFGLLQPINANYISVTLHEEGETLIIEAKLKR